jgi:hypothetical protein
MKIWIASNGSQHPYFFKEDKVDNTTKVVDEKTTGIQLTTNDDRPSDINPIQAVNNAILRLVHNARIMDPVMDESLSLESEPVAKANFPDEHSLAEQDIIKTIDTATGEHRLLKINDDVEAIVITMVESVNEVLRIVSDIKEAGIAQDKSSPIGRNGLEQVREIIVSALKIPETINDVSIDTSLPGIKLAPQGFFSIDHQSLRDGISSNMADAARSIKTVAATLIEMLPLCVDPNSGALVYTGKRLEGDGDDKASEVLATVDEELEKEKVELDKRLSVAESLISYSSKLIEDLKPLSEVLFSEG